GDRSEPADDLRARHRRRIRPFGESVLPPGRRGGAVDDRVVRATGRLAVVGGEGGRLITVWIIAAVLLTAAAAITMFRLLAGPGTLDRLVALDTFVAVTMCAIGTWAAYSLDTTVTYSLTALALISFVGSVSVARFRVRDTDREGGMQG